MKSMTKFDELWTDYLEGELDDAQHHELREFLKDPLVLEKAVEQFQLHRLLNLQAQSSDENQRRFVAATMDALPISAAILIMSGGVCGSSHSQAAKQMAAAKPAIQTQ